ncbi:thiamine phosphate synthase [Acidocella aminolytica]|jgi:thiamine-phosphate pyrophosphorylase|uniref:Thiamine-phosphate synthase n=1 Tax=Acidocella aminolytica 101 = DSM 11237 TaxID=1120923 RepID=A0A0D6PHF5_9PROT|nr:thiamine phosphate synthase [Acidocella aminolytica]GAN80264.1 thiamine phosphate pyrophosphorylase [Acidocella aminolytica 101 = DSM 11237]GBQ44689.1 thiamine phosphate pyrophosphorylase [Acidocella aminolytica 101 = DSM 11237]SHE92915.1 thiamine-phosphate pyrophosphorylase [Acidocella aminolytica 101 = DSM 11237]
MTADCRLYLITPPVLPADFEHTLASALDAGDIAALQLRLKNVPEDELLRIIDRLRPIVQSREVAFLLNDDPALAVKSGCDGAHVGQTDMPAKEARKVLGDLTLGVTCHNSRHLAMEAGEAGADYVAFGAFFPTTTKEPPEMAEIYTLRIWAEMMEIPCVAIGGINAENCAPLVRAGAEFLAVSGTVWGHQDGAAAGVQAMLRAIAAVS